MEDVREIRRRVARLAEIAADAGAGGAPRVTLRGRIAVERECSPARAGALAGPEQYLIDSLAEYADAGVTDFLIDRRKDGHDGLTASFEELAPVLDAFKGS
jgi:hypothetical protein